jgi:hypothetical protein
VVRALRSHGWLFAFAFGVAVACYGIRLFNMAFTLDEELQSVSSGADLAWIDDGREREQFVLNGPSMGLHLPPMV